MKGSVGWLASGLLALMLAGCGQQAAPGATQPQPQPGQAAGSGYPSGGFSPQGQAGQWGGANGGGGFAQPGGGQTQGGAVIPHPEPGQLMQAAQMASAGSQQMCQQGMQAACQLVNSMSQTLQQAQQYHQGCHTGDQRTCGQYLQLAQVIFGGGAGGQQAGGFTPDPNYTPEGALAQLRAQGAAGTAAHEARMRAAEERQREWMRNNAAR